MVSPGETPRQRMRIFFFLILFVAILWAVFLLQRGEMLQFIFMFAALAAINPLVAFVDIKNYGQPRTLFFFYLLIIAGLTWAVFLLFLGVQLWVSLFIFIIAAGVPFILRVMDAEDTTVPS